jgi:hypothetical protein
VRCPTRARRSFATARKWGELRSGTGDRALAMLRLDAVRGNGPPLTAGGARLLPETPPWMRLPDPATSGG